MNCDFCFTVEKSDNKNEPKITKNSLDSASDVQNCFGFDEEDEEMET